MKITCKVVDSSQLLQLYKLQATLPELHWRPNFSCFLFRQFLKVNSLSLFVEQQLNPKEISTNNIYLYVILSHLDNKYKTKYCTSCHRFYLFILF